MILWRKKLVLHSNLAGDSNGHMQNPIMNCYAIPLRYQRVVSFDPRNLTDFQISKNQIIVRLLLKRKFKLHKDLREVRKKERIEVPLSAVANVSVSTKLISFQEAPCFIPPALVCQMTLIPSLLLSNGNTIQILCL